MKKHLLMLLIALLSTTPLLAQYSPCYEAAFAEGKRLFEAKKYSEAKKYFNEAKDCPDSNKLAADEWIGKCNTKIHKAEQLAQQQAEAEQKAQAEAEKEEDAAYKKCTTIAACDSYLKMYPQGRYLTEVRAKKAELKKQEAEAKAEREVEQKEKAAYDKCTTIMACENYLKTYPQGRYVEEVKAKKWELFQKARDEAKEENVQISISGSARGHDYVDLGLPSGTLWATCNIGANKPEGYGNFYAWGETSAKNTYNWESYRYAQGTSWNDPRLTKYCSKSDQGNNGFADNLTTLLPKDDAATANWGKGWHSPSRAQWEELLEYTTNKLIKQNGVAGCLFTSKKNGRTLFLPAAGNRIDSELNDAGYDCSYWSQSLDTRFPDCAWIISYDWDDCNIYHAPRDIGYNVRPVREEARQRKLAAEKKHKYIDLGLPSGTLWATCNIGASKPEDYGDHFAWGETQTKSSYNVESYKYSQGSFKKDNGLVNPRLTKYCNKSDMGNNGFTDNLTELQASDDPAAVNWGNGWHTPTKEQWQELLDNTINLWTTQNDVLGRLFIAKNGKTLFLPAAGACVDSQLNYANSFGCYWSKSLYTGAYPLYAWELYFRSDLCEVAEDGYRCHGISVRPVREK